VPCTTGSVDVEEINLQPHINQRHQISLNFRSDKQNTVKEKSKEREAEASRRILYWYLALYNLFLPAITSF
jgi:hypothetical protein